MKRFSNLGPIPLLLVLLCVPALSFGQNMNVKDFGAVGDGKADDTAAFQKALDAAGSANGTTGGIVEVPAGHYRFDGTLSIPRSVLLQGTWRQPPRNDWNASPHEPYSSTMFDLDGSVLLPTAGRGEPDGPAFITLAGSMAGVSGFIIHYPDWTLETVPPVAYPPTIFAGETDNVLIENLNLLTSYEGIRLRRAGRFTVRNVQGYPMYRGLTVDVCLDIGRVENVHFWPFTVIYTPEQPLALWINQNGTAFRFERYDWGYVTNTFCFGYGIGYHFATSQDPGFEGGSTNGNFLGLGADSCERAILVDETSGPLQLTNAQLVGRWGSETAVTLEVGPDATSAMINLSNAAFWGPIDTCIRVRNDNTHLIVSSSTFRFWDTAEKGSPAIDMQGGKLILQGNQFMRGGTDVVVGENVDSALLVANQAPMGFQVENHAGQRTVMMANEQDHYSWPEGGKLRYRLGVGEVGR